MLWYSMLKSLGYHLEPSQDDPTGAKAFVRLAMDTPISKVYALRIQANQLYDNAMRSIEFWEQQLEADMKAIAQTIKLASSTG